ncbi:MAG: DinB family protein [Mucilaginibacter sp.]|nr:DinB family protein [Mucilaginibacter sp.]
MKAYFIELFNYDRYANQLIAETIVKADNPDKPSQLMAHLLAAQQTWLNRCKGAPPVGAALWPDWQTDIFEQLIDDNHRAWINFLDYSDPDDFNKIISYKNSTGDSFENKLSDVLAHVINHGTHHRAQAGQYLKLAGVDLPNTDYIFYIRNK